nr:E3 ubiquitin-protein like [Ipomoea batatas]
MSEIEEVAISRTLTPTEVFNPRIKRTLSQPEIPIALPNPRSSHGSFNSSTKGIEHPLHRSHSVPNLKEAESTIHMVGRLNCVIRSTTQINVGALATSAAAPSFGKDVSDNLGKDVTEDAVCRICLVELGEGSAIVKMECSCKGELALAHRECAVKWFTLKGNSTCDICRNKVQNIHVKYNYRNAVINVLAQTGLALNRYWITVPVDVICSVTAYFLFVLELLSTKGDRDPPLAAPCSIILGLIAHVISFRMVSSARKQAWVYGLVQFGFVVLFGHVLYLVLNLGEYTSVLVAVLFGFSLTMIGHMVLRPMARSNQQQTPSQVAMHPNPSSETIPASQIDLQQTDLESGRKSHPRVDNSSN